MIMSPQSACITSSVHAHKQEYTDMSPGTYKHMYTYASGHFPSKRVKVQEKSKRLDMAADSLKLFCWTSWVVVPTAGRKRVGARNEGKAKLEKVHHRYQVKRK